VQSEVVVQIARNLEVALEPEELEQLKIPMTDHAEAYREYLHGMEALQLASDDSSHVARAATHFQAAANMDTLFVEAASRLTRSAGWLVYMDWLQHRPERWRDVASDAVQHATKIAPESYATLLANAYFEYYVLREYEAALALFGKALEISEDADVILTVATIQKQLGNLEIALDYVERGLRVDPQNLLLLETGLVLNDYLRRFADTQAYVERWASLQSMPFNYCEKARNQLREDWRSTTRAHKTLAEAPNAVRCDVVDFVDGRFDELLKRQEAGGRVSWLYLFETYRSFGMKEQEIQMWRDQRAETEQLLRSPIPPPTRSMAYLRRVQAPFLKPVFEAGLGNRMVAIRLLDSLRAHPLEDMMAQFGFTTYAALTYSLLEMPDELIEVIDEEASRPGHMGVVWLRSPLWIDKLGGDPRFQEATKKMEAWELKAQAESKNANRSSSNAED